MYRNRIIGARAEEKNENKEETRGGMVDKQQFLSLQLVDVCRVAADQRHSVEIKGPTAFWQTVMCTHTFQFQLTIPGHDMT